ncbi:MAG: class I SAM-dependent methyltransferase [Candidatus Aenigmarchaeota archaeon]|nr:class I SAM-dependent methyltransferase [Candidatus Aenigmarchaeota archaeon]MDI6722043.1 class I SAM-dependent methyltransferase [Candidatus Aenigmarchaeota archaeon]
MTTTFSTRIIREAAKGRKMVLDGGCGNGLQACYLAKRNPKNMVYGYDTSGEAIEMANKYKQKHGIDNVNFSVASHDMFQAPYEMDMIYTIGSLVSEDEVPSQDIRDAQDIFKRRLKKFNGMLMPGGIYVLAMITGYKAIDTVIKKIAEECRLPLFDIIQGETLWYAQGYDDHYPQPIFRAGLIFERS